ncbi:4'-phosphopantetheinyl transferase family protein [Pseudomonas lundensis]|uniref:Enterobactin synthase component D n=1 Tax=Pseudomonas lundensis TaxID=86185 RepID=A0ABX4GGY9_9PSED|nr:4'-phosphopantetheinyl transferase superfamily protein [Pseudomonas lundensis]AOZ15027.1 4'-phosphopantetheinyl transferase [Pseudomonas lundensis]MBM1182844.1 4'-phosphopantetheinyl transferase superfamily protein [Pseudomonas lundensis]NMZ56700.1 4'-phosphopantetheinyl transferase superfamily protein [Pseudomonas lundensis]NNA21773.1 4'-phosphopantetheinyl transferase superfamily protein [Pseudomonas lundensis]NNA25980.1 4'-phosphopantetheinyl transferase superfamily protein [Pseudomonas 
MTRLPALPACCTPLRADWPLPQPLPGSVWRSTDFTPAHLLADDFARSAIEMPASIQRSVAKRQAEFLAGRLCARAALLHLDGTCATPAIGEDRAPVWPAHIAGAITHSNGRAGAVVALKSEWQGLGIDLENLLSDERARRLVKEILTPGEQRRMAEGCDEDVALVVTLTFSIKESLFKALFPLVGQRFYFEHAEVLSWSKDGHVRLRLLTDLSTEWHHGKEIEGQFAVHEGQLLSLVAIAA